MYITSSASNTPFSIDSGLSSSVLGFRHIRKIQRKDGSGSSNAKMSRIGKIRSIKTRMTINKIVCKEGKEKKPISSGFTENTKAKKTRRLKVENFALIATYGAFYERITRWK